MCGPFRVFVVMVAGGRSSNPMAAGYGLHPGAPADRSSAWNCRFI